MQGCVSFVLANFPQSQQCVSPHKSLFFAPKPGKLCPCRARSSKPILSRAAKLRSSTGWCARTTTLHGSDWLVTASGA
ncbi:protein of unknown function [Magnetospirillum sp. XM-1]|nr:protein of unknown function [Magnetospirillum sp. XM-1]